jgi:hypothetical protein
VYRCPTATNGAEIAHPSKLVASICRAESREQQRTLAEGEQAIRREQVLISLMESEIMPGWTESFVRLLDLEGTKRFLK